MKGYLLIIIPLLIVTSILISLNIFFQHSLQMQIAEDFNAQQLILAQSISHRIKEYLKHMKDDTISLSYILSKMDGTSNEEIIKLKAFFGLTRTNMVVLTNNGSVIFQDGDIDVSSEKAQFLVKKAKSVPFGSSVFIETPKMIYCISPFSDSKKFIFLSLNSIDLAKEVLTDIQAAKKGNIWILTGQGDLLYHPTQTDMAGRNIYSKDNRCFDCHASFDFERNVIENKMSFQGKAINPNDERLLAYSKVQIDDILWTVFLSANYSNVIHITEKSMKVYSYLILTILTATVIFSAILFIFNKKRLATKELEIKQQNMEKYADALEENVKIKTSALIREREKLTTILNAIGGGIILIDKQGKIVWANDKIKEMFEIDVIGKYCEELWVDCDISSTYTKDNFETTIMSMSNEKFLQIITAPVKNEQGEIYRYIRLIQDITEIKKMEEQITNSEKLASIGRLAAGIAHEIGNPLTSIFSYVQILKEIEDDQFKKEGLETIYFHIERISETLKQLSNFTKMPFGEMQLSDINELIENTIKLIQYDKQAKKIVITKELSNSLPQIITNTNQLSQVFINLILNAIDAMPDGGKIFVRSYIKDNNIVIDFEDTGIGIPKENLLKIFDPFYTTKEKGTGLGLAVSYNIIKKMNGMLTVDSEVRKGTVFKITLPITEQINKNAI